MSCYETVDANGTVTRNFVGDATIQLQSADGTAAYQAPTCNDPPPGTPIVVQDTLPAYTIHTSISGQSTPVSAPELSVPEPSTAALFVVAMLVLLSRRRARSH
jgi:hypothetical protein